MKNNTAFTLIELLVVISIIALLVSILMPALSNARQQATGAVCLANQKTLALSWVMYYDDNDGMLVWGGTGLSNPEGSGKTWAYLAGPWACSASYKGPGLEPKYQSIRDGLLYPYIENVEAYHCPGDKRYKSEAESFPGSGSLGGYRSYGLAGGLYGASLKEWDYGFVYHTKASTIKHPSEKYAFVEEADGRGGNVGSWVIHPIGSVSERVSYPNGGWWDAITLWHNDASTMGFCDGHAELHRWLEVSNVGSYHFYPPSQEDLDYMLRGFAFKRLDQ